METILPPRLKFLIRQTLTMPGVFSSHFLLKTAAATQPLRETSIPVKLSKPLLFLTESSVNIERGESFNSILYIQTAIDQDGSSLSDSVIVTGEVDTSTPGTYTLTYTINSKIEKQSSANETLTVTVK